MIGFAAAVAVAALSPAPRFAPPVGQTLRVISEVRDGERRFTMERLVRFSREGGGYRAELVIVEVAGDPGDASGALFQSGMGSLKGRIITLHLDTDGRITVIDGMAGHWGQLTQSVAEAVASRRATSPAARQLLVQRIAGPLRALPAEQQREMLGSLFSVLLAEEADASPGIAPVQIPGTSPFGGEVMLEGNRQIDAAGHMLRSSTRAWADVTLPAEGTSPARAGRVELEIVREIDPDTGLVARSVTTSRTAAGGEDVTRITTLTLAPAPPGAWPQS